MLLMVDSQKILRSFDKELHRIENIEKLEELSITYLGRNGKINTLIKTIKDLPQNQRKKLGLSINRIKHKISTLLEEKKTELANKQKDTYFDSTLPGKTYPKGSLHPITYTIEEISRIFEHIGFVRVSYPEIEWEYFAFEALNMPKGHPARDDFETFFIDKDPHNKFGKMLLTPHTSSGQTREMKRVGVPPIRMINIAKTYRPNWDTTHTPMFHQFEGLCVDEGINITHLKGTIEYFVKRFFGNDREIRLRPAHFQFTEPSFEVDVSCGVCGGTGGSCRVCKSGWLELAGAGLVHPKVLTMGGVDPRRYSGWAFGFGPERCMMMRNEMKLDDIRILYSGDIRFLEQF